MTKGIKRINDAIFTEIKQHISKHGTDSAAKKWPGYNRRTILSISKQADYKTWREKRRGAKKAVAKPQAIHSVVQPQSVATEPKKPGHGRRVTRVVSRVEHSDDVTREEFDRVTGNLASQMTTLKRCVEQLREDVDSLLKEDVAYREADILIRDKSTNSVWSRIANAVKGGRR